VTTTYFSFKGVIYQQNFGAAMGSPVFPLLANLFMEWLEKQAIATAPVECKPKFWKRYVDDVLELIKKGQVRNLTDHINTHVLTPLATSSSPTKKRRTSRSHSWTFF